MLEGYGEWELIEVELFSLVLDTGGQCDVLISLSAYYDRGRTRGTCCRIA